MKLVLLFFKRKSWGKGVAARGTVVYAVAKVAPLSVVMAHIALHAHADQMTGRQRQNRAIGNFDTPAKNSTRDSSAPCN